MFTGIISGTGTIKSITGSKRTSNSDRRIRLELGRVGKGLKIGDSVSVNGTCLTVIVLKKTAAEFEIVKETMDRTTLGSFKDGDSVNIERSLKLSDRFEGHIVLGHVDGVGEISDVIKFPAEIKMWIRVKGKEMMKYLVPKGSVTVDGISLTVVDVGKYKFSVALVPHTVSKTTIGTKVRGDTVNLEFDILSKYLANLIPKN
ncbi:MAG: riboflavin synthase [Nitrososphaeraceae archaeon]|jgi:riboflavin synthase|nr:riboflavin synthase [Nitrososphaeraceae archaeon]